MKIRLELAHKKAKIKKILLKADTVIGRSTECGLRIASNEVSRQHCKICISEEGVTVRDLGSSNGTFVNGYQLEPDTDYEIAPDSELSLGSISFFVRFSEPPPQVMQSDGLGSTVDLKPGHQQEIAALERADREAKAAEEEMQFEEAAEINEDEPAEEASAEAAVENDTGTVQMMRPAEWDSVTDEAEYEMSTHGDSAILEREEESLASEEDEPEPAANTAEEEAADLELEEAEETPEVDEVEAGAFELDESEEIEEAVDLAMGEEEAATGEPELESADESAEEAEAPENEKEVTARGEELDIPDPDEAEMDEEDVASFLNQVADEDPGEGDDEPLGDFFKQFD